MPPTAGAHAKRGKTPTVPGTARVPPQGQQSVSTL
jgi:hypothetical protein